MKHILEQTLNQMPTFFSGNSFSKQAQKNGLDKYLIVQGVSTQFLHKSCSRISRRSWQKKVINFVDITPNEVHISESNKLAEAIKICKSHNLRVMKQISDWVEL